jgi:putative Mg2+ transporter-C (MgtC) family protein
MLADEFLDPLALPIEIIALRLVGATLLCALIGFEREAQDRAAGLRTHMLVGLASATYAVLTLHIVENYARLGETVRMDPVRMIEAVTAGVAFLAAGMIVLSKGEVRNLTTGAGMWLAAAIGLAAGAGVWAIAVIAAVLGLAIIALNNLWR